MTNQQIHDARQRGRSVALQLTECDARDVLKALGEDGSDDIGRSATLANINRYLVESDFSTDDLNFILIIVTALSVVQPAATYARLLALRAAEDSPPAAPAPAAGNPA